MKEIASTMPSHMNTAATATAEAACTASSLRQQSGENGDVAAVQIARGRYQGDGAAAQRLLQFVQRGCPFLGLEPEAYRAANSSKRSG
jgi:hypothetical protein